MRAARRERGAGETRYCIPPALPDRRCPARDGARRTGPRAPATMPTSRPTRPAVRPRVYLRADVSVGPGKIDLLKRVDAERSISAAARAMGMSYKRAWELLAALNHDFGAPVIVTATGGRRGGGAALTPLGHAVVERYEALEARVNGAAEREIARLRALVARRRRFPA